MTDVFTERERAILDARTASVARAVEEQHARGRASLFFRVGRRRCAAWARSVRSVIRLERLSPAPASGRALAGGLVRAGEVIPVFHLAAILGDRLERLPETAHALLLGAASDEVALTIDALEAFGEVDETTLEEAPEEARSRFVLGATKDGTLVIDLDVLLASEALWVDASQSHGGT